MIAPLRETAESSKPCGKGLTRARRLVAATLLEERAQNEDASPRRVRWKAWALAAGVLIIIATVIIVIWMI